MAKIKEVAPPEAEMGQYNKALMEEPLSGFDLFLKKERGVDKDYYWGLPINEQIELEERYAAMEKSGGKKASSCCG